MKGRYDRRPWMPDVPDRLLTPLIVACALFMENLDSTVLSTSLPAIAADLHENPISLKLALTSYLLSLAVFIPASGWAADRFGARTIFRGAIVVFTIGSILCGFSSTLPGFVTARIVQGIGGAMMVPVGRLVLLRSVERHEIVQALAYLTMPALIGPIMGPPLGGFITTYFHWRWIFWINVPIGLLGVSLATLFIKNVKEAAPRPLDLTGFVMTGLGFSGLMFGLTAAGPGFVGPLGVSALIAGGLGLLLLYVRHAGRAAHPILDLRLLRIPTFGYGLLGGFLFRVGIGALPFLLPLLLQLGFGQTPFQSGCLTFAAAAGAFLMKTTAQPILRRFGFRRVLVVNAVLSSLFLASYALFTARTPWTIIFGLLLGGGFFRSLEFTSVNAIAYADIDQSVMSRATSFASVAQQLSQSTGIALGAFAIEASRRARGDAILRAGDFSAAFVLIALISAASALAFSRLSPDAGDAMTRRQPAVPAEKAAGAMPAGELGADPGGITSSS